jgi:MFS-type transporter involved in bile tolerance (Atg22 family)
VIVTIRGASGQEVFHTFPVAAAWFVFWAAPFVGATQAAEPNQYAQRARQVTEHIQKKFYDSRSGVYLERSDRTCAVVDGRNGDGSRARVLAACG